MARPKVLLVKDDEQSEESLESILFKDGYKVILCDSLERGIELMKEYIYRTVIVEKNFTKNKLAVFVDIVKKQIPKPGLIILSDTDNELELLTAGADDWLKKPFETSVLLAKIAVLCR